MAVKAIIFDFWGTLVENGVHSPIKQIKDILRLRMPFSEYVVRAEKAMMTSQFSELREAFIAVCKEFNVYCQPQQMEELIGMWNKSWMLALPYDEVESELGKLKQKYQLVLAVNTDCFSAPRVIEKSGWSKYFDQIYYSWQMGVIKTDPEFYPKILTDLGITADECVVVGDSLQSDIEGAKKAGIKAVLIDRKNLREFSPKIGSLKQLEEVL